MLDPPCVEVYDAGVVGDGMLAELLSHFFWF